MTFPERHEPGFRADTHIFYAVIACRQRTASARTLLEGVRNSGRNVRDARSADQVAALAPRIAGDGKSRFRWPSNSQPEHLENYGRLGVQPTRMNFGKCVRRNEA